MRAYYSCFSEKKTRRERTTYSSEQLRILEAHFVDVTQHPDVYLREQLAKMIGLSESRIQVNIIDEKFIKYFTFFGHLYLRKVLVISLGVVQEPTRKVSAYDPPRSFPASQHSDDVLKKVRMIHMH